MKIKIRMKNFNRVILLLVVVNIFCTACIKDKFDAPKQIIPHVDFSATMTIAEFKATYSGTGIDSITQDIIINGKVISSDESGNIYKSLYIEDNTGGLLIALDKTNLYTTLKLGQEVYVKCKGLYLGAYGGMTQLGFTYNGSIGRIPYAMIDSHIFPDSLPSTVPAPLSRTIAGLSGNDLCMRIKLDNVHFKTPGELFAPQTNNATSIKLYDDNNDSIILYNSKYANFASLPTPKGKGSIIAILGSFNGTYQLYINSYDDLVNWDTTAHVLQNIISETFTSSFGNFTTYSVTGAQTWTISSYGAKMSGYSGGHNANEDWLISPSVNFDNYTNEKLSFVTSENFGTVGDGSLKLYYSVNYTSGDPTLANWTEITGFALSPGNWTSTPSGIIDLSAIAGTNVHIAFKYTSTTSSSATWEITNFILNGIMN